MIPYTVSYNFYYLNFLSICSLSIDISLYILDKIFSQIFSYFIIF